MLEADAAVTYYRSCQMCPNETTVEGYDVAHEFSSRHVERGYHEEISTANERMDPGLASPLRPAAPSCG